MPFGRTRPGRAGRAFAALNFMVHACLSPRLTFRPHPQQVNCAHLDRRGVPRLVREEFGQAL
eukprot:2775104-Pleurochrysis_carterae.AAC.1